MPLRPHASSRRPALAASLTACLVAGTVAWPQVARSASAAAPSASAPRAVALADLHRVQDVSDPHVSPDGQWVAYVVARHDLALDATVRRAWVARMDGTDRHPLNAPPRGSPREAQWALSWGPGRTLYYLGDGGDAGTQVWRQSMDESSPTAVTHLPFDVSDYALSPDGRQLAVIADDPAPRAAEGLPEPPLVTERFQFMDGDVGQFLTDRRHHLHLVDIASGDDRVLTPGPHDEWSPSWSPDGRTIAYVSKRGPDPDRHSAFNLFAIGTAPDAPERRLTDTPSSDLDPSWGSRPEWSPDGHRIAFLRSGDPKWLGYSPAQLAVLDVGTLAVARPAQVDRFFYAPRWSADGRRLYALREDAESTRVVKVDLATGAIEPVTTGARLDTAFGLGPGDSLVVDGNGTGAPPELFAVEGDGEGKGITLRPLSKANDDWLAGVNRQPVDDLVVRGRDGTELHAMWVPPTGTVPGRPVRTIVQLHGGPVYQFSHGFMFDWQWFAAQGWGVLAVNPRGSSGRGFDFARAIHADWGRLDVQDVLDVVDAAVARGLADPRRLVVGGHSYGAMLTDYVIASDRRFRAATSSSGAGNQLAMYGADMYARDDEIELGTPWRNLDTWMRVSYPFLHADRIATPTLFFCGGDDFNVPCIGSQQMYQALRSQGVPTRLVRFPKQGHELDVPSYLEFRLRSSLEWYERFIGER